MKVSNRWLQEWVNPGLNREQLAAELTMAGIEVDAISPVAAPFTNVVVAEVVSTSPHPQADRLTLCVINDGNESLLQVVCGASNVRAGLKVALAQINARLPNDMVIKKTKLRGELSQGMLCSGSELGMGESSDGIMELDNDAPIGTCLREYLMLDDFVLDLNVTPNRADCLSIIGIARETAAITNTAVKQLDVSAVPISFESAMNIEVDDSRACPVYYGRVIKNIVSSATLPLWMAECLRRSGIRSIHPVVDILNYVMLELGQPMHAFDSNKIGKTIRVRTAKSDEKLHLLDDQIISLASNTLLIADETQVLAIAGIMGGQLSGVTDETTTVFIESAFFNPIQIAGVARKHGLFTDSAQRFERGVDSSLQKIALERASGLIQDICGGEVGSICGAVDQGNIPVSTAISFDPHRVKKLIGVEISNDTILSILTRLHMQIDNSRAVWHVTPPSYRFDINVDADLVEEVIRIYGYNTIFRAKMITPLHPGFIDAKELLQRTLNSFMVARGYSETINYSFVDPELQQAFTPADNNLNLLNPISSELSQMRSSLWPGLIASMLYNNHRQQTSVKIFETGVVFTTDDMGEIVETSSFAGLIAGDYAPLNWSEETRKFDFFDLKGDLQALVEQLNNYNIQFNPATHPALHPGKSAEIMIDDKPAGWLGVVHPRLADALDCKDDIVVFQLDVNAILANKSIKYKAISKFPKIKRDLSLLVDKSVYLQDIDGLIRKTVENQWLKSLDVFDVYTGETIAEGKKSVGITVTLQNQQRTFVDSEIHDAITAIITALHTQLAITLRE